VLGLATCDNRSVILEHAILPVRAGLSKAFEAAFHDAVPLIAGMPGFHHLRLSRCIERPDYYLLLVEWNRVEDHTEGFRSSPEYQEWRGHLHQFYEPFPVVEHYETITTA
jgi:heme-degrading monooxygenase HmoA